MRYLQIILVLVALLLFVPGLGLVHLFDWDEINFAECAREMLVSGNYARVQIEFLPFWEKPPLFFWLQAAAMQLFGVNEFAARFPNALAGVATVLILYRLGTRFYNEQFALLWVLLYVGSFLPHLYFKSGIIDPIFNLFIFLSIYQIARWTEDKEDNRKRLLAATFGGIFMGFAILTKGPVALFLVGLCGLIYWLMSQKLNTFRLGEIFAYAFMALFVSAFWYLPEMLQNGFWFIREFIDYQIGLAVRSADTGHEQPFWYHPVVLLFGCFPASIFFFGAFRASSSEASRARNFRRFMQLLFWVTLVVFSIVKAKIIHYSSLCYFPLTYLAAYYLYHLWKGEFKYAAWLNYLFAFVGILLGLLLTILPLVPNFKEEIIPMIDDPFAVANLQAEVTWLGFEFTIGIILLLAVFASLVLGFRRNTYRSTLLIFGACLVVVQLTMYLIIPKIEGYSQRAVITFLESISEEDAYVSTLNYHSYAHYYYGRVSPEQAAKKRAFLLAHFGGEAKLAEANHSEQKSAWNDWLINGKIDRPAFLICKIDRKEQYSQIPQLEMIAEQNGFVFFKRLPVK